MKHPSVGKIINMKTLIILTDFSKTARNAATTALEIAIQLHSNVLLVNSYLLPLAIFSAEAEGRALMDSALIAAVSETGLKKEARRLKRLLNAKSDLIQKPEINILSAIDSVNQTVQTLSKSMQISMMVVGAHHTWLPFIFSAIDLKQLLAQLNYPLLIIPKNHSGITIKNFVFAADFGTDNHPLLHHLLDYAKLFNFQIHLCHVSPSVFIPDFIEEDKVANFERYIAILGQGKISFTVVKSNHVAKAINACCVAIGADLLGIIYHPHGMGWKMLHENHSAKLIRNQKLPLIIFPTTCLAPI